MPKKPKIKVKKTAKRFERYKVFNYQSFLYISKLISFEQINKHYDNLLVSFLKIKNMQELIIKKYYWLMLLKNIKAYIKQGQIYLALKVDGYKPYIDF